MKLGRSLLAAYAALLTLVLAAVLLLSAIRKAAAFDEISVHRINIVEPDGTLPAEPVKAEEPTGDPDIENELATV
jgi:hypothetical protein